MFETYEVTFEVYVEDKLNNKQTMQAPKEILTANFLQTAQQIQRDKRPIKFKMIVPNIIWDEFEGKQKILNNGLEYSNDAMVIWEENNIGKNQSVNS
jgi:hypothetical protein